MAFKRQEESRDLELPTLIDVVFLLLIFFLVTVSVSAPGGEAGWQEEVLKLPEAEGSETVRQDEVLGTLVIQISHKDEKDSKSPKIAYVLWPSLRDSLTLQRALKKAKEDSSAFREFPADFLKMSDAQFRRCPPCSLIAAHIDSYKAEYFREPSFSNCIEMRAEKDTEFRIVNHIMGLCSAYGDTIPRLVFRTLSEAKEKEVEGGL